MRAQRAVLAALLLLAPTAAPVRSATASPVDAAGSSLAQTPPMGWLSNKAFRDDISESLIKQEADALVSSGMRRAGYRYVIVDGGWRASTRDANGNMRADPVKFPHGMKAIGDYLHARGLKFGLHQAVGVVDCKGTTPGTQSAPGGERQDATTFASWGVDVLKYDLCDYRYPTTATPGAPDFDAVELRQGDRLLARYEAESPANTLSGDAHADRCSACSGRSAVTAVGMHDGAITIPKISAPAPGSYTLVVRYANVDRADTRIDFSAPSPPWPLRTRRMAQLSVNGATPVRTYYPVPRTAGGDVTGWGTVGAVSLAVELRGGDNTLRISDPASWEDITRAAYQRMADAIQGTGRSMLLSVSEYGMTRPWMWAPGMAATWRTSSDLADQWSGNKPAPGYDGQGQAGITNALDKQVGLERYARPGHWNDPNTIEAGLGHLSTDEYRSQFSLWSVLAAPLVASNDLRTMSAETRTILLNTEVIAVGQDTAGAQGTKIRDDGNSEVWARRLADGSRAVVLFNRGEQAATITVSASELGLASSPSYRVRDLWAHTSGTSSGRITAVVPVHGVAMFRVSAA